MASYLFISFFIFAIQGVLGSIVDDIESQKIQLKQTSWDLDNYMDGFLSEQSVKQKIDAIFAEVQNVRENVGMLLYGHSEEGEICFDFKICTEFYLFENKQLIAEGKELIAKLFEQLDEFLSSSDYGYSGYLFGDWTKGMYHETLEALEKIKHQILINTKEYLHCHTIYEYQKEELEIRRLKEKLI